MEKIKKIFLTGHVSEIVGPGHHLRDFLLTLEGSLTRVVFFPMPGTKLDYTLVEEYKGRKKLSAKRIEKKNISNLALFKDSLFTLREIYRISGKIDYYVGLNNFDTFPAILFKGWKVKNIIYYGSDYADDRFTNKALNLIYRIVELVDLRISNLVVSNTKRAEKRRIELGLAKNKSVVIPNGVDLNLIPKIDKKVKYDFVYLGYLSDAHGVLDFLGVFKDILSSFKGRKLAIVGSGPAEKEIGKFIKKYKLEKNVDVVGKLKHHKALKFLKQKCAVGIASYNVAEGWTKYASPLKVKEYLACGLAVIISDVPEIAEDIKNKKMGFVYKNNNELYSSMEKFCQDKKLASKFSQNARNYIKNFDWSDMYKKILLPNI